MPCSDSSLHGFAENPLSLVVLSLEAVQVAEFDERGYPFDAVRGNSVEDVHRATSCFGCDAELSELLMTVGQDLECSAQFEILGSGALEKLGCLFSVSQCVVGRSSEAWPTANRCWYRPPSALTAAIMAAVAVITARSVFNGSAEWARCGSLLLRRTRPSR